MFHFFFLAVASTVLFSGNELVCKGSEGRGARGNLLLSFQVVAESGSSMSCVGAAIRIVTGLEIRIGFVWDRTTGAQLVTRRWVFDSEVYSNPGRWIQERFVMVEGAVVDGCCASAARGAR